MSGDLIAIDGSKFRATATADQEEAELVMRHEQVQQALQKLATEGVELDRAESAMNENSGRHREQSDCAP